MRINENMEVLLQSIANLFGDLKLNVLKGKLEDVIALQDTKSIADFTEGVPEIIINRMPDDVTLKDNPYKNIHVRYESEENCSHDFDRLKLVLN